MYFEAIDNNDYIEIATGDYTDMPEKYKDRFEGLNAINNVVFYNVNGSEGILFDELFWTYELPAFLKGVTELLDSALDEFELFKNDDYFNIRIKRLDNKNTFYVNIFVNCFDGDLKLQTEMTTEQLLEIKKELEFIIALCPPVKCKEEQLPIAIRYLNYCYNYNNFTNINEYLADDCQYSSQWAFEAMTGKDEIAEYLIAKSKTIKEHNAFVKSRIIRLIDSGDLALALYQGDMNEAKCLVKLKLSDNGDIIEKYDNILV